MSLQATDIAIVSGARTPMGRYCGKLRDFTAVERSRPRLRFARKSCEMERVCGLDIFVRHLPSPSV